MRIAPFRTTPNDGLGFKHAQQAADREKEGEPCRRGRTMNGQLRWRQTLTVRYARDGVLLGLAFSFAATWLDLFMQGLSFTLAHIWQLYIIHPLHWTMPPAFLGILGGLVGRGQDRFLQRTVTLFTATDSRGNVRDAEERRRKEQEALYQLTHDLARATEVRTMADHLFAHT